MSEAQRLVLGFFRGDASKTRLWFRTPNPLLGGVSPNDMVTIGRGDRLLRFVREQLAENREEATT